MTETLQLPLYLEGDADLILICSLGSVVYGEDYKMFCPMSRIRPVMARLAPQW
jgi:hypothetical protein